MTRNVTSHLTNTWSRGSRGRPDSRVASAARLLWAPLSFSLIGRLMFLVPVPYRKSLSWNTLRARKRAEAKDGSSLGVRGQENGLLRKPKEPTPPPPLASPATRAKGKVSRAHAGDVICVCPKPLTCPTCFYLFSLNPCVYVCARMCVCVCVRVQTYKHTHTEALVVLNPTSRDRF